MKFSTCDVGRLPALVSTFAALLFACSGGAQAGVLSDFEDGTAQGWYSPAGAGLTPTMSEANGGLWSLRVDRVGSGFQFETLRHDGLDHLAQWYGNTQFKFDYKIGSFTTFLQTRVAFNPNTGNGTTESSGDMPDPNIHLDADGQWHTFTWSYPQVGPRSPNPGPGYFIEWIVTNSSGDGTFWIDNIRTVPEPASAALCVTGVVVAASAFRYKRRKVVGN